MLIQLDIQNIALIDRLVFALSPGMNVLTGETGAGKSIVVDALNLVLGERADRELIRAGADKATVEALFDISRVPEAKRLLAEMGIEAEDDVLAVTREITGTRSISRVQGVVQQLSRLRELTQLLVDVHGQHEHQQLTDPRRHMAYLDAFGSPAHQTLLARVREAHDAYRLLQKERDALTLDAGERARMADMLAYQIREIDEVKPKRGEEEALAKKNALMRNAERVMDGVNRAYTYTYQGDRDASAQEKLKRAGEALRKLQGFDERFGRLCERLEEAYYLVEDIALELGAIKDELDFDPGEAERVDDRLHALNTLTRKYGPTVEDVLTFREDARARLEKLENNDARIQEVERALAGAKARLLEACDALTESREALARTLCARMLKELGELGMEKARFEIRFARLAPDDIQKTGQETVEFMLSANVGSPVKPLRLVASGGELSRIMLAMKTIEADAGGVDAMVFDEVDTGVSGRMAQVVGEKMARIAAKRQVICVTHLPQIAALADSHFLVEKFERDQATLSNVRPLNDDERVLELARMVGGAERDDTGKTHARNMLKSARALTRSWKT